MVGSVKWSMGFKNSSIDRPVKLLRGFDKVGIQPGETKTIEFEVNIQDLAWYDAGVKEWKVEEMEYELYVGANSLESNLIKSSFHVK